MAGKGAKRKYHEGARDEPEYVVWKGLRARCNNPNHTSYVKYGGRGLKVSTEFDDYAAFIADIGKRPSKLHWVDRVDNTKGYEPGNVRWVLPTEQARNTRRNRTVVLNGEAMTLVEWCERLSLPYSTIRSRLHDGWTDEAALTTPVRKLRRSK